MRRIAAVAGSRSAFEAPLHVTADVPDYFSLFGLPPRFAVDLVDLRRAYDQVMELVHPDRHVLSAASQRRAAMQMASLANQAWNTLRSDVERAAYLCQLGGVPVDGPGAAKMRPEFLEQQWAWREALEAARDQQDGRAIASLASSLQSARVQVLQQLRGLLDEQRDLAAAAEHTRMLMFLDKFQSELGLTDTRSLSPTTPGPGAA